MRPSEQLRSAMAACSAVICAGTAWLAWNIDSFVRGWAFAMPGTTDSSLAPATFPRLVLCLVALLAAANLIATLLQPATAPDEEAITTAGAVTPLRVVVIIAACFAYLWLLPRTGYMLTSAAAIFLGALAAGYRRWLPLIAVAVILPPATWYAFRFGMKVLLPESAF